MSDYTPTTEEVKHGFTEFENAFRDLYEVETGFDRWLAEVIREAKWVGWEEGWDARVFAETVTPTENPYRQGEGSGNGASQSPVESSNLLNGEEQ